jgi:hypothetical protein
MFRLEAYHPKIPGTYLRRLTCHCNTRAGRLRSCPGTNWNWTGGYHKLRISQIALRSWSFNPFKSPFSHQVCGWNVSEIQWLIIISPSNIRIAMRGYGGFLSHGGTPKIIYHIVGFSVNHSAFGVYWSLLGSIGVYSGLLGSIGVYWGLLGFIGVYLGTAMP